MTRSKQCKGVYNRIAPGIRSLAFGDRGVTGLETAIIMIAFVVVVAVFAFTVLSTGTFSSQKSEETAYAGLTQARGGVRLQGSVIAHGVVDAELSDADITWTTLSNVTATLDTTDKKEGTASGELAVASAKTGLLAYENISPTLDLSSYDSIQVWLKSDITTTSGQMTLVIDDTTGCSSPTTNGERISVPVLTASTWKKVVVGITASTTRTAIACVGLYMESSLGAAGTINFDDVLARGQSTSIVTIISNTIEGVAVDLTPPTDADADGIADSEDRTHVVLLDYADANQYKSDLYWTKTFIGVADGDDLLEEGERVKITMYLAGLDQATPLTRDTEFTITIKPKSGSMLSIQRTTPSKIDPVMNLN